MYWKRLAGISQAWYRTQCEKGSIEMQFTNGETLRKMLRDADAFGYAVPMFNYTDLWDASAALEAAQELHAPIMFASIPKTVDAHGVTVLGAMGSAWMDGTTQPLIHHLDHSNSVELCKRAVDAGYPSVMIDASKETLEENIKKTRQVCAYAHARNAMVEAEIGRIKGRDYEGTYLGDDFLVQVEDAIRLVEETGVDSLAVGIGTAHGFYEGKPEINFQRLAEVNEAVTVPLVLHGGTGIPEEDVRRAIKSGINKVNVGTEVRFTYMSNAYSRIGDLGPATHTVEILLPVREAIKEVVKKWILVCMADGKA